MDCLAAFILVWAAMLQAANCQNNQTQAIKAELGKQVTIPCSYVLGENETFFSLLWKKGTIDILAMGAGLQQFQGNYRTRASVNESSYQLTLAGLAFDDAGEYECTVLTTKGANSGKQTLEILAVPTVVTESFPITLPGDFTAVNEKTKLAECSATGASPPFTMKWVTWPQQDLLINDGFRTERTNSKNANLLDATLDLTIFPDPARNNGRKFLCVVTDAFGKDIIKDTITYVSVLTTTPPTTTMQASPKIVKFPTSDRAALNLIIGANREVECAATGVPAPSVTWYQGMEVISDGTGRAVLLLNPDSFDDSAEYRCVAMNEQGEEEQSFQLNVQAAPAIASSGEEANNTERVYLKEEAELVSLTCQASGNPLAAITWEVEGANSTDVIVGETLTQENNLAVSAVRISAVPFRSGSQRVKCVAFNNLGKASKAFIVSSPVVEMANTGLIVGVVIAVLIVLVLVFFIVFFTLTSRRRQKANLAKEETAETGCSTSCLPSLCNKKQPVVDNSEENEDKDQVKEVREEGTKEEKQKLTQAEEQPAEKDSDSAESENSNSDETKESKEKKQKRVPFLVQCCRGNKEELKEDNSNQGEVNEHHSGSEENGHTPHEDIKEKQQVDADSGKGDTLEKVAE